MMKRRRVIVKHYDDTVVVEKYSGDQPRDENGRFGSGGGSAGSDKGKLRDDRPKPKPPKPLKPAPPPKVPKQDAPPGVPSGAKLKETRAKFKEQARAFETARKEVVRAVRSKDAKAERAARAKVAQHFQAMDRIRSTWVKAGGEDDELD